MEIEREEWERGSINTGCFATGWGRTYLRSKGRRHFLQPWVWEKHLAVIHTFLPPTSLPSPKSQCNAPLDLKEG